MKTKQLALTYTGRAGIHPLENVDRSNPRPGLRRWVAVNTGLRDQWSAADAGERAELLAELPGGSIEIDPALGQDIVWPDGLD